MQQPIERRHGPVAAILITGIVFGLAHFTHPEVTLILLPYFVAVAAVYGALAYLTNSILPSLVLHTVGVAGIVKPETSDLGNRGGCVVLDLVRHIPCRGGSHHLGLYETRGGRSDEARPAVRCRTLTADTTSPATPGGGNACQDITTLLEGENPMKEKIFRFLTYYAAAASTLIGVLLIGGFKQQDQEMQLKKLTVGQIDIVDPQGRIRVQLAGSFPPRRTDLAGLLFSNQNGSEAGGLVYRGEKKNGHVTAGGILTMDQYNDDQIVVLQYEDEKGKRKEGLTITDRPDSLGPEMLHAYTVLDKMPEGRTRDSVGRALLAKVPPDQMPARRVFVGRDVNKSAIVDLSDRRGVPRLRLAVDSAGAAKIIFLDSDGRVVRTIPE